MGLFSKSVQCSLCGNKINATSRSKLQDGYVCSMCSNKVSPLTVQSIPYKTVEQMKAAIHAKADNMEKYSSFVPTDAVQKYISINRISKTWCLPCAHKGTPDLFDFSELLEFELCENGATLAKGGLGSAVVGGALFGDAGAIVGATLGKKQKDVVTSMYINITVNRDGFSLIKIPLLIAETKRNGFLYKGMQSIAEQIIALLNIVANNADTAVSAPSSANATDEILKLKKLLDAGAITDQEFSDKKKQLLGI